jgi:cell division protein ZapA
MALVTLQVGGRRYELHCRDGEEAHLERLAAQVDGKMARAGRALGSTNEARQLLLAALLLADDLLERPPAAADPSPPTEDATEGLADALDLLPARVEKLGKMLEESGAPS